MSKDLSKVRNIGISAHIDSGKTTLTERILFYTDRIHAIHEVRGKDGVGAKMDSMELEKERGITIQSAATFCNWKGTDINIIDTPGHVDFTVEVERALRVLDGAVLVLCSVGGVQSQSITVNRQMTRYNVPRIAFINKCDRTGANPAKVTGQLQEKLQLNAHMMQMPIGLEGDLVGMVDLVTMKAVYYEGENGDEIRITDIPAEMLDEATEKRETLLEEISMFSEELMEALLEDSENVDIDLIYKAVRQGTIALEFTPVFMGSAYKNKGVQALLDAVETYLPCPTDVENIGLDLDNEETEFAVTNNDEDPLIMLAFKLEDGRYGQLTYVRTYQGQLTKGDTVYNRRTGRKVKIGRLCRMHSDEMEEIDGVGSGDIVALFGVDCASGDTFTNDAVNCSMTSMHVPEPVISLSIKPIDNKAQINMSKALNRFTKEDPTFRTFVDHETNETIISGMGELHLEVYVERMKREYAAEVEVGKPQVSYRETITQRAEFNYTHKKQTGGTGQFGRVAGYMEPLDEGDYEFVDKIVGGAIPREFISSCDKGFQKSLVKGHLCGAGITGVRCVINDGSFHAVDSSDVAFQIASVGAFKDGYMKAKPVIMEPIMKVSVEGPSEFQGAVMGSINQRRGMIIGSNEEGTYSVIEAEVPLSEMFGYSTTLRSLTQGKAEFTMEFANFKPVPKTVGDNLIKAHEEERKNG
ncbi:elongation factor G [Desulfotalea psychrophila]|uniref:Elongation factor G 1 n=1 Tax=Desulfotalea psychrophila (strain LSv54 / DSM 12343) TaxID=177439 RepID=EFG1_DESPS|nr:elongation factor G [Desulfotalea psychrophila]Q6ASC7.1 RecName: Full=Elongation factor G 1; Short=EF-G 1 [Desulfotalea psychrophila LSv54]CAG34736.1 probable translation elongation factor EF-G [Desulfotalea psychrophila LSv54]